MQKSLAKWWSSACQITIGLDKIIPRVARVLKIIVRVGSGWPKRPRVGSNLGSGFDPTHPYCWSNEKNSRYNLPMITQESGLIQSSFFAYWKFKIQPF